MKKTTARMNTLVSVIGLILLFAIPFIQAQGQPVFRIGILDQERGPIRNGAELAVREINNSGGVRGADGTFFRLELIVQPTSTGAGLTDAVANFNQAGVIAVLGPTTDADVLSGLSILQGLNVPILTPATGDSVITADNSGRLFRIRAAAVHENRALAQFLISDLGMNSIATAQLDVESAASMLGFTTAASALGVTPQPSLLLQSSSDMPLLVNNLAQANPVILVTYGNPIAASSLYNALRTRGWPGVFVYNQAEDETFRSGVVPDQLVEGILSTTTWAFSSPDSRSTAFLNAYVRLFAQIPGPIDAASYDGIYLLAAAIGLPGELQANLTQLDNVPGVQGSLRPVQLNRGETSNNVAIIQLGPFGAPEVLARFAGSERVALDAPGGPIATPTPTPTGTPEGVIITILNQRQNVRSGPGLEYAVLGQLPQGHQERVIGASLDSTWVVINFRGQQGWLATYLLDVFGDLNSVPIITPPPTPTPVPSPTAPPLADIVIDAAVATPTPIVPGQPFNVSVTVRNAGNVAAGPFAVAATFPPNNIYAAVNLPGLNAGQSTAINLTGTLTNTGYYSVAIVADLNSQIAEDGGENNNIFTFSYVVNKPLLNQGSLTLNAGSMLDLEGNGVQNDILWNAAATALEALGATRMGVIQNANWETMHWDLINPGIVNQTSVPRTSTNAGTIIGVITADGNRGAIRVDDIPGNQIRLTFQVYRN